MPALNDTPTTWTIVDPMGTRHEPKVTESAGVMVGRPDNGYMTTHRKEVADEIKERFPHMIVTRHETQSNQRRTRAVTWTIPELPWRKQDASENQKELHQESYQASGRVDQEGESGGHVSNGICADAQIRERHHGEAGTPRADAQETEEG